MAARSPLLFISSPTPNASVIGSFCSRMDAYAELVRLMIFACMNRPTNARLEDVFLALT